MDAHGIEIFDRADNNAVITPVAHHFHLEFLPAEDALLDEQFVGGRGVQPAAANRLILLGVVGNSAATSAKGEGGSDNGWEANPLQHGGRLVH